MRRAPTDGGRNLVLAVLFKQRKKFFFYLTNVRTTSRRIRACIVPPLNPGDGGGMYRRSAGKLRVRRFFRVSPANSASFETITEVRMYVPRRVFSPTT